MTDPIIPGSPEPSPSGPPTWRSVAVIWFAAVVTSAVLAELLPATYTAPAIIAAAALATLLADRSRDRARARELAGLAARLDAIGSIADPRYNAPSRRGPVEPPTLGRPQDTTTAAGEPVDVAMLHDRIVRREAHVEEQLTWYIQARAALRAIIDGIDAPVFATDERGLIRLVNRQGDRLFRRRTGRLAGLELEELFTQSSLLELHNAAQDGVAGRQQIRLPVEGQARVFEVSAVPVRMDIAHLPAQTPQRAGVVLTLRDVTELAQADQLKTDFVANASHELRTPITSIRLAVETLKGRGGFDETMRTKSVGAIEANIMRLEEMVSDLLDLSHLESPDQPPRPEPVPLAQIAEAFDTMFAGVCDARKLELHFDFDPEITHINTDRGRLQLILRNLIDNATKFAFEGTTIDIIAARATSPLAPASGSRGTPGTKHQRAVTFQVRDRGVGIPLKHQQRIFERFYQVDESRTRQHARRGTGLGLAIVKHAVRSLGGDIAVESIWQEGTTMTVVLPDPPTDQPNDRRADEQTNTTPGNNA